MYLTMDEFIDPFKNQKTVHNKGIILSAYGDRYMRIKDKIQWAASFAEDLYITHFRIPSESRFAQGLFYDIVFELYPAQESDLRSADLRTYGVRIYSNYPTFLFSFTYTFNQNQLIIPWLMNKCSRMALSTPAYKMNRGNVIDVDIKTWFAAHHFERLRLFSKSVFKQAINTSPAHIQKVVFSQEQMLFIRQKTERETKEGIKKNENETRRQQIKENMAERQVRKTVRNEVTQYNAATGSKIPVSTVQKQVVREIKESRQARHAMIARRAKSARASKRPR